ncbi:unnamed protein product [Tilletia controversa]|uniref:Uncharacterized protein n=2 Tax=Tilletia TaxID=13289 RepID=A0A8T8TNY7_9BASI|nr:hypothetical protein CF336_g1516 [Tilletia laevis]KAE8264132.1 hypothetical protein A4X03_0g1164 [Tilletia caries]CAD6899664.1 unnamed protein product [Tilletia controversa]CAD6884254.1 unnamed protein product [Tilletia caries]CAD6902021.1 unnamed protein product [Tilletia controversa]
MHRVELTFHHASNRPPLGHHLRPQAIALYKRLHRLGREYPDPNYRFLEKLRNASSRNAHLTEDAEVQKVLDLGNFIEKEIETLYSLKKYRTMKRRYNPE